MSKPTISQMIKFRTKRRFKQQSYPWFRAGLSIGIILSMLAIIGSLVLFWFYTELTQDLPSVETLPSLLEPPEGILLQPTRIYDRSHEHVILTLENPAATGKHYLYVNMDGEAGGDHFSQSLIDATVAVYDPGFWDHSGYSISGWSSGSHPTLAQWLIFDLVIGAEPPSIQRNIRERILAAQVTAQFGREKVLEWYLNSAQYGKLIYGADSAARVYFGKSAASLSLAEAAMLTAISETPGITPTNVSHFLKQQQEQVIRSMVAIGSLTENEAVKALADDVLIKDQIMIKPMAPGFTALVLEQVSQELPLETVLRGGYEIVTTLDYDLHAQVECAYGRHTTRLEGIQTPGPGDDQLECAMAQLLPTLQLGEGNIDHDLNTEIVVIDPRTGQLLSLVGDESDGLNPHTPPEHPVGTILAPFLYLTAFTRGMSPGTLLWDIPSEDGVDGLDPVKVKELDKNSIPYHGPVRARIALVNDYLAASEEVLNHVQAGNLWLTEKRFGINVSEEGVGYQTTLRDIYSQQTSLLDIVSAYAVLANRGLMAGQPDQSDGLNNITNGFTSTSVLRVIGVDGKVWLDWSTPQTKPIISQQLTYLATHVLSDENARRSSPGHPNSLEIGRPVAVKAGISLDANDAWVVGYTSELAVGVWAGNSLERDGDVSIDILSGLWHAVMQYATNQGPSQDFYMPTGVSLVQVCDPSGLLVSALCPSIVQEVFLSGNEPSQEDNLYQKITINRETRLLATVFTPADLWEEKVYLVVPEQAVDWAKAAGLSIPPDIYDSIYAASTGSEQAVISKPRIFDHVGGKVTISGSATGPDFSYYRLQVGRGLNPQQWLQIGEDVNRPVQDGLLGNWDTGELEGLYVIQLLVVKHDLSVERAILQVTVDNTAPQVEILAPTDGERYSYRPGDTIMMQVTANDKLVMERVDFFVDNELKTSLLQPPYIILWTSRMGEHTLRVEAYDLAGNVSESSVFYTIAR